MKKTDDLIFAAIERFNEGLPERERLKDVSSDMRFFGRDASGRRLDSMALVDFLFCLEEILLEVVGVEVTIADERLLRQRQSPLRSFRSLSDYVGELL